MDAIKAVRKREEGSGEDEREDETNNCLYEVTSINVTHFLLLPTRLQFPSAETRPPRALFLLSSSSSSNQLL